MDEHTNRHTQFVRWSPNKQCQTHDLSPPIAAHVDLIVTRSNFNHVTLCDSDVWVMSLEHSHAGTNLRLVRRLTGSSTRHHATPIVTSQTLCDTSKPIKCIRTVTTRNAHNFTSSHADRHGGVHIDDKGSRFWHRLSGTRPIASCGRTIDFCSRSVVNSRPLALVR